MQVELVVKVDGLPATFSQRIDEQPVKQCGLLPYSAQAATKMDEWMRPLLVFGDTSLFGNKEQGYDAQQRGNTRTQKRQDDQDISEEAAASSSHNFANQAEQEHAADQFAVAARLVGRLSMSCDGPQDSFLRAAAKGIGKAG